MSYICPFTLKKAEEPVVIPCCKEICDLKSLHDWPTYICPMCRNSFERLDDGAVRPSGTTNEKEEMLIWDVIFGRNTDDLRSDYRNKYGLSAQFYAKYLYGRTALSSTTKSVPQGHAAALSSATESQLMMDKILHPIDNFTNYYNDAAVTHLNVLMKESFRSETEVSRTFALRMCGNSHKTIVRYECSAGTNLVSERHAECSAGTNLVGNANAESKSNSDLPMKCMRSEMTEVSRLRDNTDLHAAKRMSAAPYMPTAYLNTLHAAALHNFKILSDYDRQNAAELYKYMGHKFDHLDYEALSKDLGGAKDYCKKIVYALIPGRYNVGDKIYINFPFSCTEIPRRVCAYLKSDPGEMSIGIFNGGCTHHIGGRAGEILMLSGAQFEAKKVYKYNAARFTTANDIARLPIASARDVADPSVVIVVRFDEYDENAWFD